IAGDASTYFSSLTRFHLPRRRARSSLCCADPVVEAAGRAVSARFHASAGRTAVRPVKRRFAGSQAAAGRKNETDQLLPAEKLVRPALHEVTPSPPSALTAVSPASC